MLLHLAMNDERARGVGNSLAVVLKFTFPSAKNSNNEMRALRNEMKRSAFHTTDDYAEEAKV